MTKVLVTGHNGFVGRHLCDHLNGVVDFDDIEVILAEGVDLCDIHKVEALPHVDVIIHLAAKTFIPDSFSKARVYYHNNVVSTINILDKAKKDGARLIFLSTYVYGAPTYLPIDENHPLQPMNPYTQTKVICEQLCAAYSRDFSVGVTVLRPFNIYGPGQSKHFFIPTILSQINKELIQLQDSRPRRDYIFIKDLIDVITLLLKQDFKGFDTYNVGSGISYSVKEVVTMILTISNSHAEVQYSDIPRQGEVNECIASIKKLYDKYGWEPKFSIQDGLRLVIENYANKI